MGISICNTNQDINKKNLLDKKKKDQLKKDLNHFKKKLNSKT